MTRQLRNLRLETCTDRHHRGMLRFSHLLKRLNPGRVFVGNLLLPHVGHVENRFKGQQLEGLKGLQLLRREGIGDRPSRPAFIETGLDGLEKLQGGSCFFVPGLGHLGKAIDL